MTTFTVGVRMGMVSRTMAMLLAPTAGPWGSWQSTLTVPEWWIFLPEWHFRQLERSGRAGEEKVEGTGSSLKSRLPADLPVALLKCAAIESWHSTQSTPFEPCPRVWKKLDGASSCLWQIPQSLRVTGRLPAFFSAMMSVLLAEPWSPWQPVFLLASKRQPPTVLVKP